MRPAKPDSARMTEPDAWIICTLVVCVTLLILLRKVWWDAGK